MRAAWRLAISSLSARPSRAVLLLAAVTLSASLIAAVACAIASANGAVAAQLQTQVGKSDLRITASGRGGTFPAAVLEVVRSWPEVEAALPQVREPIAVRWQAGVLVPSGDGSGGASGGASNGASGGASGQGFVRRTQDFVSTGFGNGVDVDAEFAARPLTLLAGRLPEAPGEVVLDALLAERLSHSFVAARAADDAFVTPGTEVDYLERPAPEVPGSLAATDGARAAAINADIGVRPGDTIELIRRPELGIEYERIERQFGLREGTIAKWVRLIRPSARLTVVGIAEPPPLGGMPQAFVGLETIRAASGGGGGLTRIELDLRPGESAEDVLARRQPELPEGVVLQTTAKVTSQLDRNLAGNQIGFVLASVLAFLSASFIIMTGLTTGVAEQQRALAILRCIGAGRGQMALSQLATGLLIGGMGAALGTPLGIGFAWIMVTVYHDYVPTGLVVPPDSLSLAVLGSVASGLLGAAWPAWQVARMSPLRGLTGRAEPPRPAHLWRVLGFGVLGLVVQAVIVGLSPNKDVLFWGYATTGLPAMFVGYFLLSVPATVLVVRVLAGPISALLRLPAGMLGRTIEATPFRHGFTAGAMMAGLALMIAIWSNGGSVLRDWVGKIEFPDAFVNGLRLPPEAKGRLERLPFVADTCAITLHPVDTDAFEVTGLTDYSTTFIAFEPREFFDMVSLTFFEGERDDALRRLEAGGAVIVGKEFQQSKGLGVGDSITLYDRGTPHTFEIVGVVTSPGLEMASKFFNIGEEYIDQSIHAVFGSRGDMLERFGNSNIQLIQVKWDWEKTQELAAAASPQAGAAPDRWAVKQMRDALLGYGVLDADSGRRIKQEITKFVGGSLVVFSAVAVVSMLVACFGVANLVMAGIEARRFEFGVLRAIGGQKSLLTRLVLGEAIVIGVTAGLVGTLMGVQGAWAGQRIYQMLLGLDLVLAVPVRPVLIGWAIMLAFTVGAAAPAILSLLRKQTRELLAAARG